MLWPCQMSMLDLKFTPIELLDHEGRTCLGCSSQFGPACHLNNKLQQGLSKHEENSLYLAQIPVIFWLWTRSANDQSNDTVERQRLFCFVREAPWTHIFFLYIGHILTGSHFVPLQCHTWEVVLHLSCGFSFFLEIRVSKTATLLFCDLKYFFLLLAMKTEQSNESKITIVKMSFGSASLAQQLVSPHDARRLTFSRCNAVNKCSEWRGRKNWVKIFVSQVWLHV